MKLLDGLGRGVLQCMLKCRQRVPCLDDGQSNYFALSLSDNAKQLAAVIIAGAGPGVLKGLSEYENPNPTVNKIPHEESKKNGSVGGGKDQKDTEMSSSTTVYVKDSEMAVDGGKNGNDEGDKKKMVSSLPFRQKVRTEDELDDMSKLELKDAILEYLAADLFAIWRETDFAAEKEKIRQRKRLNGESTDAEVRRLLW